jgi:ABC-2 type transport system ATP-binding protein
MGNLVFQERRGWIIKDGACSANDHLTMAGTQTIGGSRTPRPVIQVFGIRKTYGSTLAVSDVSFEVNEGEIFGLIGPNGAGKTTTMECVEGVRRPDCGTISILGLDPFRDVYQLQNRIGVQLQQAQLQKRIKVWEAVDLWASLYTKAVDGDRLLEQLGLVNKRNAWFMTLSRRAIWELVRGIRDRGKTVFMTTHLMEEAREILRAQPGWCKHSAPLGWAGPIFQAAAQSEHAQPTASMSATATNRTINVPRKRASSDAFRGAIPSLVCGGKWAGVSLEKL